MNLFDMSRLDLIEKTRHAESMIEKFTDLRDPEMTSFWIKVHAVYYKRFNQINAFQNDLGLLLSVINGLSGDNPSQLEAVMEIKNRLERELND